MSEKYTTLHPKGDTSVDLYPNIKAANIPDGSIGATKIYPNTIGNGQLAPNAVGYNNIQGGAVHTIQILDGAVTSDKIAAGAIITAKLDTNSVSRDKIIDGAVTANKLSFHFYKYRIVLRYVDSNSHVIAPTFTLLTTNGNIDENMTMNDFIDALISADAYEFGQLYDATADTVTTAFFSGIVLVPNKYLNIEHNMASDTNIAASDLSIFSFSKVQLF